MKDSEVKRYKWGAVYHWLRVIYPDVEVDERVTVEYIEQFWKHHPDIHDELTRIAKNNYLGEDRVLPYPLLEII